MSRIVRTDDGLIHVGGRITPKKPHGLMLHAPKYGLNIVSWPEPPASTSWGQAPAAQACLLDILGNDVHGDCTEADQYHRQAIRQAAGGCTVFHPTVDQVLATYSRDGGYVPGQADTDNGCAETTVLANATALGITCGDGLARSAGFVAIDGSDCALVKRVLAAFPGGTPIGADLPDSWLNNAAPGSLWDFPSDPFNPSSGHCFTLGDYDEDGLLIWTWGRPLRMTWSALAACTDGAMGGAIYLEVNAETLNAASQLAPDGLDWATLLADFNDAGGTVIVPPGP